MSQANKINQIETGDISKINEIDASTISHIYNIEANFSVVPAGLIIPLNDTNVPNGWERFASADDKMIVGAGNSYGVNTSGGDYSLNISETTSTAGAHTTSSPYIPIHGEYWGTLGSSPNLGYGQTSGGDHSHTVSGSPDFIPLCNDLLLIKATQDLSILPANALLLSDGNVDASSLTNVLSDNRYIKSNSSIGQVGSLSVPCNYSNAGNHWHLANKINYTHSGSQSVYSIAYDGSHSGSVNVNISESIKKVLISAWTNASNDFEILPNMIGMYESLTPPDGWILCDGNNGSPDLRDYFIGLTTDGNENTTGVGDNTIDISCPSVNHSSSHNHYGSNYTAYYHADTQHGTYSWSHSHTGFSDNDVSFLPEYYALSFIMKTA